MEFTARRRLGRCRVTKQPHDWDHQANGRSADRNEHANTLPHLNLFVSVTINISLPYSQSQCRDRIPERCLNMAQWFGFVFIGRSGTSREMVGGLQVLTKKCIGWVVVVLLASSSCYLKDQWSAKLVFKDWVKLRALYYFLQTERILLFHSYKYTSTIII